MVYVMEQNQFVSNLKKTIFILDWKTTLKGAISRYFRMHSIEKTLSWKL